GRPCGIYTSLSGTAPNRIFNIEWCANYFSTNNHIANFEVRLYESTGRFDFVYGQVDYGGYGATVGVQDGGSLFTQFSCNRDSGLGPSMLIAWLPPPCPTTSTPSSTPTSTPTLTAIPTNTPTITPTLCSGNYTYSASASTFVSGTTFVPGSQCYACTVSVTLPFSFTFYGQPYGSANLSSEGDLQFLT